MPPTDEQYTADSEGLINTAHGLIHKSVLKEWGGTPEQATYTRYLRGRIWAYGVYGTIVDALQEAVTAAEIGHITQDQLTMLRAEARTVWQRCVDRNPNRPADTEETARAMQLKILSPLDFRHA